MDKNYKYSSQHVLLAQSLEQRDASLNMSAFTMYLVRTGLQVDYISYVHMKYKIEAKLMTDKCISVLFITTILCRRTSSKHGKQTEA